MGGGGWVPGSGTCVWGMVPWSGMGYGYPGMVLRDGALGP